MFQQDGNHEIRSGAKSKKHLSSKSVQELKSELDAIFEKEESAGVVANPELIAEYVAAIEKMETGKDSHAQSHDDFEKTWAHFTKNHPDLFPSTETNTRNWGKRVGRCIEAAILVATILIFSAAAFNWPDHFVEWGKELLQISPAPCGVMELVEPNTDGYFSLTEAATGAGMDDVKPLSWIPARFSIRDLAIQKLNMYSVVTGVYVADDSELAIRITRYSKMSDMPNLGLEKNDDDKQEEITKDGITYLYTENFEVLRVTWKDGNYLYSILGEVSREEMDQMVNSFYGG